MSIRPLGPSLGHKPPSVGWGGAIVPGGGGIGQGVGWGGAIVPGVGGGLDRAWGGVEPSSLGWGGDWTEPGQPAREFGRLGNFVPKFPGDIAPEFPGTLTR